MPYLLPHTPPPNRSTPANTLPSTPPSAGAPAIPSSTICLRPVRTCSNRANSPHSHRRRNGEHRQRFKNCATCASSSLRDRSDATSAGGSSCMPLVFMAGLTLGTKSHKKVRASRRGLFLASDVVQQVALRDAGTARPRLGVDRIVDDQLMKIGERDPEQLRSLHEGIAARLSRGGGDIGEEGHRFHAPIIPQIVLRK